MREWTDVRKELYTEEEIKESDLRVAFISALIDARNEGKISQRQLEEMSGIRQPVIARIESGGTDPRLTTILKMLAPLGKTLAIVPIRKSQEDSSSLVP